MSICPFAEQKLLPESHTQPHIEPRIAIAHSAGSHGSLYEFFLKGSNLESHFWIGPEGELEQYVDTNVKADANLKANGFAVSFESDSSQSANEPWNDKQVATIIRLLDWLCREHPAIKRQLCDAWDGSGIGWHIMFGTPGKWTPVAKSCPGPARIEQMKHVIIPAVIALGNGTAPHPTPTPGGPFMALTDAEQKQMKEDLAAVKLLLQQQQRDTRRWVAWSLGWLRAIAKLLTKGDAAAYAAAKADATAQTPDLDN